MTKYTPDTETLRGDLFFTPPKIVEYAMGTGNYLAKIAEQIVGNPPYETKQIESTGNVMSEKDRRLDARRHIIDVLATNEQRLWTLNEREAARHVQAAIDTLKATILDRNPKEETR